MNKRNSRLVFLPLAPVIVIVIGVLVAVLIGLVGTARLRAQSDEAAALRARALSLTLAERLKATAIEDRPAVIEVAARRSGAELALVEQNGSLLIDGTLGAPTRSQLVELLVRGEGATRTQLGPTRFSATPLGARRGHLTLVAFVRAPSTPFAMSSLVQSVAALTAILAGVAALVALALARDVRADVSYVRVRIVEMARQDKSPAGKPVPIRSLDEVGELTAALNVLVERFKAAEHAYRQDLSAAKEYDKDRSAFLAALSHELRTPLNAILGFAEVLLSEVDGPLTPDARENLTVVRTSGEHLRELIDDILDLSALESGELKLSVDQCNILQVASDVVKEAQGNAQTKALTVEITGEPVYAIADARRVRQVIGNLVSNAVKFTIEGSVRVDVRRRGAFATITVEDTGPGIAPDEQSAIFEEYQQAGDQTSRRKGTGLGLAITRRLIRMHRGFIELESELGKGSRFTVALPIEVSDTEARPIGREPLGSYADASISGSDA